MAYSSIDDGELWDDFEIESWYSIPDDLSSRQVKHLPENIDEQQAV